MSVLNAAILGLIQGLCEFLPVSSSGHLLLAQKIIGIKEISNLFTVILHLGTLAAVLAVYWKRVLEMILHPVKQFRYWLWMITATLVTLAIAFVLKKLGIKDGAESGKALGLSFLFTSMLLVMCTLLRRRVGDGEVTIPTMKWYHALGIGALQGIAILPGVSRSGATITGATGCRMTRDDAAEFSFLLSIPAIVGGAFLEFIDALQAGPMNVDIAACAVGVIVAAVSGYFAVRFMIRLITKYSMNGFAIYTGVLGLFVILDKLVFHLIAW